MPGSRGFSPPSYQEAHWGEKGSFRTRRVWAPDPSEGELIVLGTLTEIVYLTVKGGDGGRGTDYTHEFERSRPLLCYNRTGLVIAGGGYKVSARGIVG